MTAPTYPTAEDIARAARRILARHATPSNPTGAGSLIPLIRIELGRNAPNHAHDIDPPGDLNTRIAQAIETHARAITIDGRRYYIRRR